MNEKQKEFIQRNTFRLMQEIPCSDALLEFLKMKSHIGPFDIEPKCIKQKDGETSATADLLRRLQGRTGSFESLVEACEKLGYSGASNIFKEHGIDQLDQTKQEDSPEKSNSSLKITKSMSIVEIDEELDLANADTDILDFMQSIETLDVVLDRPDEPMKFVDAYNLSTDVKGLALILNIIEFHNPARRRNGANRDAEYLSELLTNLGYKLYPESKKTREKEKKRKAEILEHIQDFKDRCFKVQPSSIIVFIGSHGYYPNRIETSDPSQKDSKGTEIPVTLDLYMDIVGNFFHSECPVLKGKPKIFLVQTCQSFVSFRTEMDAVAREAVMEDAIVCMAQSPGGNANRDTYKGTWFVYCLTYVMMKNVKNKSFQEILEIVKVMLKKIEGAGGTEQTPMIHNWELKKLYFPIDP